jgi:ankyrin repeat protein
MEDYSELAMIYLNEDDRDEEGNTKLHRYTAEKVLNNEYNYEYNYEEQLDKIINNNNNNNVNINAKNIDGETALHIAVLLNPNKSEADLVLEYIKALIKYNIDINATDKRGETALHKICKQIINRSTVLNFDFDILITKLLLDNGAKINLQNYKGKTALHLAMGVKRRRINKKQINILLINGADTLIKDENKKTPLCGSNKKAINYVEEYFLKLAYITLQQSKNKDIYNIGEICYNNLINNK